jgi:antitoxin YefM
VKWGDIYRVAKPLCDDSGFACVGRANEQKDFDKMQTVYRLNADELNHQFLEALQTLFKDREIEITVSDVDETAYLLRSEANRVRLLQAVQNINDGQNTVEVPLEMLQ